MTISVNGAVIGEQEVLAEMQHHPAANKDRAMARAAEALIVRALLRQRAVQLGLLQPGDEDPENEESALAALVEREVQSPIADETALRRYFDTNRDKFQTPLLFEAAHILVAKGGQDSDARLEAKNLAKALIAQLTAEPQGFAALAARHSACSSAGSGGHLGQLSEGEVAPELETFLRELEEGQLCPVPVETKFGYHVLRLDRRYPRRQMDFETARPHVRATLEALSRHRAIAQYIALLAGESCIEGFAFRGAESPLVQ